MNRKHSCTLCKPTNIIDLHLACRDLLQRSQKSPQKSPQPLHLNLAPEHSKPDCQRAQESCHTLSGWLRRLTERSPSGRSRALQPQRAFDNTYPGAPIAQSKSFASTTINVRLHSKQSRCCSYNWSHKVNNPLIILQVPEPRRCCGTSCTTATCAFKPRFCSLFAGAA